MSDQNENQDGKDDAGDNHHLSRADLLARIRELEAEKQEYEGMFLEEASHDGESFAWEWRSFFRINENIFLDEPSFIDDDKGEPVLIGSNAMKNKNFYFERHDELAFVFWINYDPRAKIDRKLLGEAEDDTYPRPHPIEESLQILSKELRAAIRAMIEHVPDFGVLFPKFDVKKEIEAPYLFMFHCIPKLPKIFPLLTSDQRELLKLLTEAIVERIGDEYDAARECFSRGVVTKNMMKYLIQPGQILVGQVAPHTRAFMTTQWATEIESKRSQHVDPAITCEPDHFILSEKTEGPLRKVEPMLHTWQVSGWTWQYDGNFERDNRLLEIILEVTNDDEEVPISDLSFYPITFASEDLKERLTQRGRTFWSCRNRRYVSHRAEQDENLQTTNERYMIDIHTYKKLHAEAMASKKALRNDMGDEMMAREELEKNDLLYLFPPTIHGYNLRLKKWVNLHVDQITDVVWNKEAFNSLVIEEETKELIQALLTSQLNSEESTDLIMGKGNGLIILLHGGPGTGKTLTAESVAEIAEKPLYRVSCGDVGTKAEAVEQYLDSVLYLGSIWGCVILFDEADVFLEERTQTDLERNALVSVFLRVLEYYEGILVLTSNRVGTFDEAFRSRIQLALHYENLTTMQRRKIWHNFMKRLESFKNTDIDIEGLKDNVDELAELEMNGREIRNAITIARQLATYRKERFRYKHLKHVIGVASKFDKYLKNVKEGFSADEIARGSGLR